MAETTLQFQWIVTIKGVEAGDLFGARSRAYPRSAWLRKINRMGGFVSPRPGIRFLLGAGPDVLTIIGPDGEWCRAFQEPN